MKSEDIRRYEDARRQPIKVGDRVYLDILNSYPFGTVTSIDGDIITVQYSPTLTATCLRMSVVRLPSE